MSSINTLDKYNDGSLHPENYNETYLATKYIQAERLLINLDIVRNLKNRIEESNLYYDNEDLYKEIVAGLIRGNIILQGPPGTGKTTLASIICDIFNVDKELVTAVSDWTTYDTIGGYQPAVDDKGNEIITGKNGRVVESVKNCCETILSNKYYGGEKQATWLIIDELNRCEIDKVFGDLFTAFGSDKIDNRKIPLWFNDDLNKKTIYIPQRFRIIGLMNNYDKNFVFDLSHGLARRFTIISVLPPDKSKFLEEIEKCKSIILNKFSRNAEEKNVWALNKENIDFYFNDNKFTYIEAKMLPLLEQIRYEGENHLNLQFGTAQIIDFYENIILQMRLDNYEDIDDEEKNERLERIWDSAFNSRLVPQMDGVDYLRLKQFYYNILESQEYQWLTKSLKTISEFI